METSASFEARSAPLPYPTGIFDSANGIRTTNLSVDNAPQLARRSGSPTFGFLSAWGSFSRSNRRTGVRNDGWSPWISWGRLAGLSGTAGLDAPVLASRSGKPLERGSPAAPYRGVVDSS
jgi:hypothetical protein